MPAPTPPTARDLNHQYAALDADLRCLTGARLLWKPNDSGAGVGLAEAHTVHLESYCLRVKADPARLARCRRCDNLTAADWQSEEGPRWRTCPFGVRELVVPIRREGTYVGCALLGAWRDPAAKPLPAARAEWAQLPAAADAATVMAAGRLVAPHLAALAGLQDAEQLRRRCEQRGDAVIVQALHLIESQLLVTLRAEVVAAQVGLSTSRFLHRFAAATGESFGRHLALRLAETAAKRLVESQDTVAAIGLDLGWTRHSAFSAAFRRALGCTPSAYRERAQRSLA
jgi:AraC-like DNA-binding protein